MEEIIKEFGKEHAAKLLNNLLRVICSNQIIIDFQLLDEVNLLFVIKDSLEIKKSKQ